AAEMVGRIEKRLQIDTLAVKTFHSLGLEIIGQVEGKRPSLSLLAEDDLAVATFVDGAIRSLAREQAYKSKLVSYFLYHLVPNRSQFDFKSMADYVTYCNEYEPRTLNGELVKSYEELAIANYLFSQGVAFRYE